MASTVEVTPTPAQALLENSTGSGPQPTARGGNRNRNRGPARRGNYGQQDQQESTQQERNGSQQSRRGNKGKNESNRRSQLGSHSSNVLNIPAPPLDPPPGPGGGGTFGSRLTKDAISTEGEVLTKDQDGTGDEDEETEVCFICASPVVHNSVAPCNHRTCHICALRLRALYKTRACAHCRVSLNPFLIQQNS